MKKDIHEGILEILPEGFGFLRNDQKNFAIQKNDPYLSAGLIRQLDLRAGLRITGEIGRPKNHNQSPPLTRILKANGKPFEKYREIEDLKSATSIDPEERLTMTMDENDRTGRFIDLFTPIGKGQRGMIISPPKAGKTTILKHIAKAVLQNHPEMKVLILLIDERPEEVTDFKRDVEGARVFHSSADEDVERHLRITTLTMNMAARQLEFGEDVLVVIDSLTRMGRAFNKDTDSYGKTMTGGLGANALELPRRFFGSARNIENGGSLTIMATILVDTGSRMDDVIFHEFKGTGNLDLVLSRECAERRLYPAINVRESGTRKEQKLLSKEEFHNMNNFRRKTAPMKETEALEYLLEIM